MLVASASERIHSSETLNRFEIMRFFGVLVIFLWSWTAATVANTTPQTSRAFDQLSAQAKKAADENRLEDATRLYTQALVLRPKWTEG